MNRLLAEARSVLLINSVEPHYFAGYTGGRKSLFPGLAGYDTVWANHRLSMEPGSETLVLTGNPVHEDLEEAMAHRHRRQSRSSPSSWCSTRITASASQPPARPEDTFRQAVAVADKQFVLDIDRRYEVVVAVAPHPMDCNLYQTNKAIQSGALAVKDGGVLIVVSECPFGLGENQTLFDMLAAAESPAEALERANLEEYRLGVQQATRIASHPGAGGDLGGHLSQRRRRARDVHDPLRRRAVGRGCRSPQARSADAQVLFSARRRASRVAAGVRERRLDLGTALDDDPTPLAAPPFLK